MKYLVRGVDIPDCWMPEPVSRSRIGQLGMLDMTRDGYHYMKTLVVDVVTRTYGWKNSEVYEVLGSDGRVYEAQSGELLVKGDVQS
jgi:hypothetical protein